MSKQIAACWGLWGVEKKGVKFIKWCWQILSSDDDGYNEVLSLVRIMGPAAKDLRLTWTLLSRLPLHRSAARKQSPHSRWWIAQRPCGFLRPGIRLLQGHRVLRETDAIRHAVAQRVPCPVTRR